MKQSFINPDYLYLYMGKELSLLNFMVLEHGTMCELLVKFRFQIDHIRNEDVALRAFNNFKEKEQEHVFIEENVVFDFNKDIKKIKVLDVIKKQHKAILKLIEKIDEDLKNKSDVVANAQQLQELMKIHVRLEEEKFYPVLDKELKEHQKKIYNGQDK